MSLWEIILISGYIKNALVKSNLQLHKKLITLIY